MARDIHDYDSLKEAYGDLLMFERFPGPVRSERVEEFVIQLKRDIREYVNRVSDYRIVREELDSFIELVELPDYTSGYSEERALLWFKMYRSYRLFDELGCSGQFFTTSVKLVNPESGRINPYWGASLYLLSALTRWPELRIAVIGDDYMAFAAAKEAFNLSQNERIVVELAANFYNAGLFCMPGFEMVCATCDTAFALILEAFRLRRAKLFFKDGEVYAE